MTSALALPQSARHPSWYLPLLLPALPALAQALRGGDPAPHATPLLILLLALGALLSFGLPALAESLEPAARKEINLLRPTWLASLFLVQVPLALAMGQPGGFPLAFEDLPHMLFFATSALLAAIPFGMEFEQRTLAGLLSQPVPRHRWWTLKTGCLAAALALHGLIYTLSLLATGHPTPPLLGLALALGALLAWATTPWWTLRTRGLLPGLVLAIATPVLLAAVLSTAADALVRYDVIRWRRAEDLGAPALTLFLLAAYAIATVTDGRRRWFRLEATDAGSAGDATFPRHQAAASGAVAAAPPVPRRSRSGWACLAGKELRLQFLTLAMLALTGIAAAGALASRDTWWIHDSIHGALYLLGAATILLAGALPIAEERRLGTLDAQLVTPASRAVQWWLKVLPGAVLAAAAAVIVGIGVPGSYNLDHPLDLTAGILAGLMLFASCLLASSCSASGLRAVVIGAGHFAACLALLGTSMAIVPRLAEEAGEAWRDRVLRQPEVLRQEVRALGSDELARLDAQTRSEIPPQTAIVLGTAGAGAAIPALLALLFARLNFTTPGGSRARGIAPFAACLALTAAASVATLVLGRSAGEAEHRARTLATVHQSLEWEKTLTPAEHLLWERHRPIQDPFGWTAEVPLRTDLPGSVGNRSTVSVPFPIPHGFRAFLIERARIADDLRDLLKAEAARDPASASAPPSGSPAGAPSGPALSPRTMFRYGLLPAAPPVQPTPPTPTP